MGPPIVTGNSCLELGPGVGMFGEGAQRRGIGFLFGVTKMLHNGLQ